MSKIQVNEIVNHFDNGSPNCPRGLTVTGVSTFSGNVSIGGTLSYEDVTNIDSVGIITAQQGLDAPTDLVLRTGGTERLRVTSAGITSVTGSLEVNGNNYPTAGSLSNRNIIINGAMNVSQRYIINSGQTATAYRACDRFRLNLGSLGTWTVEQHPESPDGFRNSFKMTCTTADASPAGGDNAIIMYKVEAQDAQRLAYGTPSAKPMTLSFWIRSNKTGDASLTMLQNDNSNKMVSYQYTINSANTWEYKTITIPGDTSGQIDDDNGEGLQLEWWINSGSTFQGGGFQNTWTTFDNSYRNPSNLGVGGTFDDYIQITGVQLELGSNATPFEHRSYGDELAKCQRYYGKIRLSNQELIYNESNLGSHKWHQMYIPFTMRTDPSVDATDLTTGGSVAGLTGTITSILPQQPGDTPGRISSRVTMSASGGTARYMYHYDGWNGDYVSLSAEL